MNLKPFLNLSLIVAVLLPLQASLGYASSLSGLASGYSPWDHDTSLLMSPSGRILPPQDEIEYDLHGYEGVHACL